MDFSTMTVAQIKEYALENNIDIVGIKTKVEMIAKISGTKANISSSENTIISEITEKNIVTPKSLTFVNDNNIIASKKADIALISNDSIDQKKEKNFPVYSDRNIHWMGIGSLSKGYNIIYKEDAEKWLSRPGVRKANPDEVATYYGIIK